MFLRLVVCAPSNRRYQFVDTGVECALGAAVGEVQAFPRDQNGPRVGSATTVGVMETVQEVPSQSSSAQTGAAVGIPFSKSGDGHCVCSSAVV